MSEKYHRAPRSDPRRWYKGDLYDSIAEANYARMLDLRVEAGDVRSWKRQSPTLHFVVNGKKICRHIIDFEVTLANGDISYVEIKGARTRDFNLKLKLLEALYPEIYEHYELVPSKRYS